MKVNNNLQNENNGMLLTENVQEGINTIVTNLTEGKPVVVGVTYKSTHTANNYNKLTDHFVTIVGMGYDENVKANYFSFYDNVGNYANVKVNRLYLYKNNNNLYFKGKGYGNNTYIMSEVRPNTGTNGMIIRNWVKYYIK